MHRLSLIIELPVHGVLCLRHIDCTLIHLLCYRVANSGIRLAFAVIEHNLRVIVILILYRIT